MSWPRQNFFLHYQVDKCWIFQEGVISWSGTNFQNNITELYERQYGKLLRKDLGSERFNPFTCMSDRDRISPHNIKQTSDENKEKYQLGDYKLIQHQILQTNITTTVWHTVRGITNEILGVKGLIQRIHLTALYTSKVAISSAFLCLVIIHLHVSEYN